MVLIFSNEPHTAQLLNLALLAQGGESFMAGLNEVSLATFNSLRPSCVIVDTPHISHPEPLQLITALRSQSPQIGLLLCTAVYSRRFESWLAQAGVDDVLRKPFTLETARRQIQQLYTLVQQRTLAITTPVDQSGFSSPTATHLL